jgi:hypothetical protein
MKHSILTVFLVLASLGLFAQSSSSVISGNIKDLAGAVIPGAQVRVINEATGAVVEALSNEQGLYRASSLAPGSYRVEVTMEGFDRLVRGPVVAEVGQVLALDLTLQVGKNSQTVTVTEAAPLVESQSSNVSQLVSQKMLVGLPLPSRTASSLAALAPGVIMIDAGSGTAENYPVFSVAGGRARNQNFVLDGGNVSNAVGLTRPQQLTSLPVDAMQEFRVIANNYAAEYGHSTGGIVTMSTRSGTNAFHGSIFESLQNDALNARNFFAKSRPQARLNQFGGTFGGPIQKDKTHFFVTWEQTRQLSSDTVTSTVPTPLNRTGDFSDIANRIYDPLSNPHAPFEGNRIPLARLDPVALASLNYLPSANLPGLANNFVGNSANTLHRDIVVGRLDRYFRSSDIVTARYYINDASTNGNGTYGIPSSDPLADVTDVRIQSFLIAHTHTFGPTLANDLRFTYLRRKFLDSRPGGGDNRAGQIGLTAYPARRFRPSRFPVMDRLPGSRPATWCCPPPARPSEIPPLSTASRRPSWIARFWIRCPGITASMRSNLARKPALARTMKFAIAARPAISPSLSREPDWAVPGAIPSPPSCWATRTRPTSSFPTRSRRGLPTGLFTCRTTGA